MFKTIIKFEIDNENDKRFFSFQNEKRKFEISTIKKFIFFFRQNVFVFK